MVRDSHHHHNPPGVLPGVWGPLLWRILHTISFAPVEDVLAKKEHVESLFDVLLRILPCQTCRTSYAHVVTKLPCLTQSMGHGQLSTWVYHLHKLVNDKLGAPTPPFKTVAARFAVRPVQWTPADVWDLVALLGLNSVPHNHTALLVPVSYTHLTLPTKRIV